MAVGLVQTCSGQVECGVPARKLWQAAFTDAHIVLPKVFPDAVSHVSYDDGPGADAIPGVTSRTIHFHRSYAEAKAKERQSEKVVMTMKERLQEVDREGMRVKMEMVEGGLVGTWVKWAKQSVHIAEQGPASCVVHWSFEYEPLSEELQARLPLVISEHISKGYEKLVEHPLLDSHQRN